MRECGCDTPADHADTHPGFRDGWCRHCGGVLADRWLSDTEDLTGFLNLAQADYQSVAHCQIRELAGRDQFGLAYLTRNNPAEAQEEAADGQIYCYLEVLKDRRSGESDVDFDLLDAARHFALAHQALARRRGRSG